MRGLTNLAAIVFLWTVASIAWDVFNLPNMPSILQNIDRGVWIDRVF